MKPANLIFVYNANSGPVNALLDSLHKTFFPKTYHCKLCAVTYSSVAMKREWRNFIMGLGIPVSFLHRDELKRNYERDDIDLPAVLTKNGNDVEVIISSSEVNRVKDLKGMIKLVKGQLT